MRCEEIIERLIDTEGADVASAVRSDVEPHLEACPSCRKFRAQMDEAWQVLGTWRDIEPSKAFVSRVMAEIAQDDAAVWDVLCAWKDIEPTDGFVPGVMAAIVRDDAEVWQMLGAWADVEPSPAFTRDVLRKVESEKAIAFPQRRRGLLPRLAPHFSRAFATLVAAAFMVVCVLWLQTPKGAPSDVLEQNVRSWDAGRHVTVIDDLPGYVKDTRDVNLLDEFSDPSAGKTDDVLEEVLNDQQAPGGT